jgi:hypothetical protein
MHGAQDRSDITALIEDLEKGLVAELVTQKGSVHQIQLIADQLGQIGMQSQPALLRVKEDPEKSAWLFTEDQVRDGMDLAFDKAESVDQTLGNAPPAASKQIP